MASITIRRAAECAGQNHVTIAVTGDVSFTANMTRDDLMDAISAEERETLLRLLLRFAKIGRTAAQWRTLLSGAGVTVTV